MRTAIAKIEKTKTTLRRKKTTRQRKRTTAAPAAKVAVAATAITTKYMRKFKRLLLPQQH